MSDLDTLETSIMADIAAASDEQAIEAVRVGAIGKKGSVSELLKTLGRMTPDERKEMGPRINGLRDRVSEALTARRQELRDAAIEARLARETVDVKHDATEAYAVIPTLRVALTWTRRRRGLL